MSDSEAQRQSLETRVSNLEALVEQMALLVEGEIAAVDEFPLEAQHQRMMVRRRMERDQ